MKCYEYDKNGNLSKVILPIEYLRAGDRGAGTLYAYDAMDRPVAVTRADGILQEGSAYDGCGRLVRSWDGVGNRTVYTLDKWGRVTEIRQADGSSEYYGYDLAGNLTRSTDGEGRSVFYEYNAANLLSAVTDAEGFRETYAYDAENRLCRKRDRNGAEILYTYNMYGNPLERRAKAPGAEVSELSERYEYTAEGLLRSAIARSGTGDVTRGMRYSYAYDSMGRLAEKSASGRTLLSLTYDLNGNLTRQTDVTGKVTEYRHDLVDRVSGVWDNGKRAAGYEYNPDGRAGYGYDAFNRCTEGMNLEQLLKKHPEEEDICCYKCYEHADANNLDLQGVYLIMSRFEQGDFTGTNLTDCYAMESEWNGCRMRGTVWKNAKLFGAAFRNSDLRGLTFAGQSYGIRILPAQL